MILTFFYGFVSSAAAPPSTKQQVLRVLAMATTTDHHNQTLVQQLLRMIKTLPEIQSFEPSKVENSASQEDLGMTGHSQGFVVSHPRSAEDAGKSVDVYTKQSIENLQQGRAPVGFSQFWRVYAEDANRLGYSTVIAEAFMALQAADELEGIFCNCRRDGTPFPNSEHLKVKLVGDFLALNNLTLCTSPLAHSDDGVFE